MPIEFSCNTDGDWRGPTGNLFLAGSVAHPLITCSHSLTKRSIAIGSCGGSRIEHGHYLEGGQHRSRKSYLQLHQNMIELILYRVLQLPESFIYPNFLHVLVAFSLVSGRMAHWEANWHSSAHCLAGCQCLGELWVAGGAIVLSPDPVTAKSQRPHAKNCTDME